MPRDSAAADRPASYLVGTAAAFPLFFRDRTKPINQLPFSPSAKFPKSGSSCESRVKQIGGGSILVQKGVSCCSVEHEGIIEACLNSVEYGSINLGEGRP